MANKISNMIIQAFQWLKRFVKKVINGVLSFAKNVVGWFKNLNLNPNTQTPFIANANAPELKEMIKNAPVKNVGIFEGVYNEETNEIEHAQLIEADAVDKDTYQTLGNETLVVLN